MAETVDLRADAEPGGEVIVMGGRPVAADGGTGAVARMGIKDQIVTAVAIGGRLAACHTAQLVDLARFDKRRRPFGVRRPQGADRAFRVVRAIGRGIPGLLSRGGRGCQQHPQNSASP